MTITVDTCPRCNALVMSDAAECHLCHYVFDQQRSKTAATPSLPTDSAVADDLEQCPKCGESYRKGLVRCSSCGAFTRAEIEVEYQKRLEAAGNWTPERFDLPEYSESGEFTDAEDFLQAGARRVRGSSDDSEFELQVADDDFDFELADDIQLTEEVSTPAPAAAADTVMLNAPAADSAPVVETTAAEAEPKKSAAAEQSRHETDIPHSEATGGDVLLQIAQQEEADIEKSKKTYRQRVRGEVIVYCPRGCRIRVTERHRGKTGKCPRCGSPFVVPRKDGSQAAPKAEDAAPTPGAAPARSGFGKWRGWMSDLHAHAVVPAKLKIKPDSLLKDFQEMDIAFSEDGLLVMSLVKAGGLLGGAAKKKPAARAAAQSHLAKNDKADGLPIASHRLYPPETLKQIAMGQPTPPDLESIFGGIPVFGASRIAVRLPKLGDETATQYLSFNLLQFREFVQNLQAIGGPEGLGANTEAPLTDSYTTLKCHYTDQPVQELINLGYYQGDSGLKLELSGWRCEKCSLVVSEDARKKEKIGGLDGKGIAKAKCPKCGSKFGEHPLYHVAPSQS